MVDKKDRSVTIYTATTNFYASSKEKTTLGHLYSNKPLHPISLICERTKSQTRDIRIKLMTNKNTQKCWVRTLVLQSYVVCIHLKGMHCKNVSWPNGRAMLWVLFCT